MPNFIDNLVHKAFGSSLLTKPEPSLKPGFELFSQTSVFPERKPLEERTSVESPPDEKLSVENLPVETSQDFPLNTNENINARKTASEKLSSISGFKFHASSEKKFQKPLKKTSIDISGITAQTEPEISKSNKRSKDTITPSQIDHEEVSSKSVNISPTAERHSLNLGDVERPIPSKPVEHSGALASEPDWKKQTGPSISPEPQVCAQNDIPNKSLKSEPEPGVVNSEFRVYQPALEMPPAKDRSPLSQKDEVHIVNVEPAVKAHQQGFIKELIRKTNSAALSSAAERGDVKTTPTQPHKEVQVKIGRIEIKASQQASPQVKPSLRGFEDHIMMRLYLDRHYF